MFPIWNTLNPYMRITTDADYENIVNLNFEGGSPCVNFRHFVYHAPDCWGDSKHCGKFLRRLERRFFHLTSLVKALSKSKKNVKLAIPLYGIQNTCKHLKVWLSNHIHPKSKMQKEVWKNLRMAFI